MLKIINKTGAAVDTKVFDGEKEIKHIRAIDISIRPGKSVIVNLEKIADEIYIASDSNYKIFGYDELVKEQEIEFERSISYFERIFYRRYKEIKKTLYRVYRFLC